MSRLYFMTDADEMLRRRARVPPGSVVEAWPDLVGGGTYWVGEESKALLDTVGEPLRPHLAVPADRVSIFYGPRLDDLDSLPREESLRARTLSVHGIAVAWVTVDQHGRRVRHDPTGPADPIFHLRRPGGGPGHVWRRFDTRDEALRWAGEDWPDEPEATEWARAIPAEDFEDLLRRHAVRA